MKKAFSILSVILFTCVSSFLYAQDQKSCKNVSDYFSAVDAGNFDAISAMLTDDFQATAPFAPVPFDKLGWKEVGKGFKTAFPDMKHQVSDCISSGNRVAIKGIFTGTNTGPNMGNPATGNKVTLAFNAIFELNKKGKIKSLNTQFDMKTFEAQLMAGINPNALGEAVVLGIVAAADEGNTDKLLSYFAPDAKHYFSGIAITNDDLKNRVMGFKTGFPDVKRSIEIISNNNNVITCKGWLTGTNTGSFMGQAATGNKIKVSVLAVYKLNNEGKVTEAWVEIDSASMLNQLKGSGSVGSSMPVKQ